ncbi:MAG: hypothetical protein AAGF95_16165, partial [Chloroflexota bacterium]
TNTTAQTPNPTSAPDTTSAPIQGPTVISNDGAITNWEYFGHESVMSPPSPADNVREFGDRMEPAWLAETDEGYELVWGATQCATQPIVVIAEASLDLWPGEIVTPDCEAMEVFHPITITIEITTPLDQWTLTLHPPSRG